jgi:hypothetical protein
MTQLNVFREGCYEVELVTSPHAINSLTEIPHQVCRVLNPDIMALSTGFIYVRLNPEYTGEINWGVLRAHRNAPEFQTALSEFYFGLGIPMTEAVKVAGLLPAWHLDKEQFVEMGELSADGQRVFCKMFLGPLATVTAYRNRNQPALRHHIGLYGKWSNNQGSGIWVMDSPKAATHTGLLLPGNIEQLNADLDEAFMTRWPFFVEYGLTDRRPKFEVKTFAELRDEFPKLDLISRDDHQE